MGFFYQYKTTFRSNYYAQLLLTLLLLTHNAISITYSIFISDNFRQTIIHTLMLCLGMSGEKYFHVKNAPHGKHRVKFLIEMFKCNMLASTGY